MNRKLSLNVVLILFSISLLVLPLAVSQLYQTYENHQTSPNPIAEPTEWIDEFIEVDQSWPSKEWLKNLDEIAREEQLHIDVILQNGTTYYHHRPADQSVDQTLEVSYKYSIVQSSSVVATLYYSQPSSPLYVTTASNDSAALTLILFTIVFLLLLFLWYVHMHTVKPLQTLNDALMNITKQKDNPPPIHSHIKEVNELTEAFTSMNRNLQRLQNERSQLEHDRDRFMSSIVHDLRTPLFSLKGYLEGITTGVVETEDKKAHYLSKSLRQAWRMDHLLTLLSNYNRSLYLTKHIQTTRTPIIPLINELIESLDYPINDKQLMIVTKIESYTLSLHQELMHQALENVLTNAIRYSPSNGTIKIEGFSDDQHYVLRITDEGPGIQSSKLAEIFKPLVQGDESRNTYTHIGLGLAISQQNIASHGGQIAAYNSEHAGATFVITLPLFKNY
ncbi:two-component sensor kinase SA14-24 [Geomicrobium sp. JCM 19037]|nr:two-component sensor kinase SA14-24 [Geomicrobium sp. JCM 19037]